MNKIFFLEFFLTTSCNQKCKYCNIFSKEKDINVDEDLFEFIIKFISSYIDSSKIFIELSGGEPGLVKNLYNLVKILKKYNIGFYQIMSNGLVRKKYDWWKEIPFYKEHLIYEIKDKTIIKFYNDLDIIKYKNIKNVIVMTQETTQSLIKNFNYFKKLGLIDNKYFWYKILAPKTEDNIKDYYNKLKIFYQLINYPEYYIKRNFEKNRNLTLKKMCALHPPHHFIDMESSTIGHCGIYFKESERKEITEDNLKQMLNFKLFQFNSYCKNCYLYPLKKDIQPLISTQYNKVLETYE